ncbi:hypothetical protein pdam_00015391, partial [Pocillopora damicornis]
SGGAHFPYTMTWSLSTKSETFPRAGSLHRRISL